MKDTITPEMTEQAMAIACKAAQRPESAIQLRYKGNGRWSATWNVNATVTHTIGFSLPDTQSEDTSDADLQSVIEALEKLHVRAVEAHEHARNDLGVYNGDTLEASNKKLSIARSYMVRIEAAMWAAKGAQDVLNK